ncbi:capsular biosynthesis protein [Ammoniphilus oxalaticus]|uniref:Capsular biosynthesis protein n=1 Tax=Ammoniphilus oxalaticus TaxID=66863 RepID=A0A419SH41_9BACL|nr:Wzz/FepE/Etk N-terminal domain-containing protein [Ammoniphilus oxalaticus]RKD23098.1 capsular biosynthesis protein [Ammoniphilus oxalaticus]
MENQETTIELRELFEILKKRMLIIILVPLIAALTSGLVSFFALTPIYEASTQILVNKSQHQEAASPSMNDIQSDLKLIETYNVIFKSPRILEPAIRNMSLDLTPNQLSGKVKVSAVQGSQVMAISVEDPDPAMAVTIANGIAATFQQEIKPIMNVDNVQILSEAKVADKPSPIKPKSSLNIAIAFVVGLMTAVGIAFLLEYLDNTVKTEQDVEQILELTVLASISTVDPKMEQKAQNQSTSVMGGNQLEL